MKKLLSACILSACAISASAKIDPEVLALGEVTYSACVACHGPDGKGVKTGPLVMAPSLHDSDIVKGDTQALALVVLKGIKKENADYVQQMLALQEALDDKALAAVITYVRHTFAGAKDEVSAKQVSQWRCPRTSAIALRFAMQTTMGTPTCSSALTLAHRIDSG